MVGGDGSRLRCTSATGPDPGPVSACGCAVHPNMQPRRHVHMHTLALCFHTCSIIAAVPCCGTLSNLANKRRLCSSCDLCLWYYDGGIIIELSLKRYDWMQKGTGRRMHACTAACRSLHLALATMHGSACGGVPTAKCVYTRWCGAGAVGWEGGRGDGRA